MRQCVIFCNPSDNSPAAKMMPFGALKDDNGTISAYGNDDFVNHWEAILNTDKRVADYYAQPYSFFRAFGGTYSTNLLYEDEEMQEFDEKVKEVGVGPKVIFGADASVEPKPEFDSVVNVNNVRIV